MADLKKQASVRGRWSVRFLIFCIIAVSLTAAGIIFFIYYRYKKAGKREIPYYEQALQDLEKLCRKKFFSSGKYREFYYEFSTIVKHFLDGKTGRLFSVLMTTEIKDLLPLLLPGDAAVFSGFFSYADRVKFALFIPEKNTTREYLEFFIRQFSAERLSAEPVKNEGPLPEEPVPAPVLPALPEEI
ncbi:MAG TPA: hypothetical protein DC049_11755 [Spirochaetia bacterium]|nr:hypothetical protein [Spirochaetia bacterium]